MKYILTFFALALLPLSSFAYEFHQYDKVKTTNTPIIVDTVNQPKSTKIYDEKGNYKGEYVQKGNSTKFYDSKGVYQKQILEPIKR